MPLEEDLTTWDRWWELNGDGFLAQGVTTAPLTGSDSFYLGARRAPEAAVRRLPDQAVVESSILPALRAALTTSQNHDLVDACLVAMARIGQERATFPLGDLFVGYVTVEDQNVRETAALALGLAGGRDGYRQSVLASLACDDANGRKLSGGPVRDRTRAFAAYGLGFAANASDSAAAKERAFAPLAGLLDDDGADREVKVAAIHAIGLMKFDAHDYHQAKLQQRALEVLDHYLQRELPGTERVVQAHCPTAMARLLERGTPQAERFAREFADELLGNGGVDRRDHLVAQSCALALGQIVAAEGDAGAPFRQALLDAYHQHKDAQTRNFAALALGRIGGAEVRAALLREFDRANRTQQKPWCALALGMLVRERGEADFLVADTLTKAFEDTKEPGLAGALAIALGLAKVTTAADAICARLLADRHQVLMAAHLCEALALLGDPKCVPSLRKVMVDGKRSPEVTEAVATALGRLGDGEVQADLVRRLVDRDGSLETRAAAARALAAIGDDRSVAALVAALADQGADDVVRTHAAEVLGAVTDRRAWPWSQPLATDANYRAAVATLTDHAAGVLDRH